MGIPGFNVTDNARVCCEAIQQYIKVGNLENAKFLLEHCGCNLLSEDVYRAFAKKVGLKLDVFEKAKPKYLHLPKWMQDISRADEIKPPSQYTF